MCTLQSIVNPIPHETWVNMFNNSAASMSTQDNDLSKQIISFLQEQANKSGKGQELSELMSSRKTYLGWLVHERFPSIPTKIAPYLLRSLP